MRHALSLTLAVALLSSSFPVQAQRRYLQPPPPQQYAPPPPSSDWTHVAAIAPGTKVVVSAVGLAGQDDQYFVSATDRELTLLLLFDTSLSRRARAFVIKLAGTHPEMFVSPTRWAEYRDGPVGVNPDGVFIRGRKVADLSEITKVINAGDVAEVARHIRTPHHPANVGAPPAEGIAALVPFLGLGFLGCHSECGRAAVAIAAVGGPIIVASVIAARRANDTTEVVYRVR